MRRYLIAICLFLSPTIAKAEDITITVSDPRPYGYFLGDVLVRQVDVVTRGPSQLRVAALPRPGPQLYWLDLVSVDTEKIPSSEGQAHRILLKYQMFYSALEPKRVAIPKTTLYFSQSDDPKTDLADTQRQEASPSASMWQIVPELEVIVSPLREIIIEKSSNPDASPLRADALAHPIGTGDLRTALLISSFVLALSIAALAYQYAVWPFRNRKSRPFTHALRAMMSGSQGHVEAAYAHNLRALHRAFDEAHGRRVFSRDVSAFLNERPEFRPLEIRVRDFFEASSLAFFAADSVSARARLSRDEVDQLARDLAQKERGAT